MGMSSHLCILLLLLLRSAASTDTQRLLQDGLELHAKGSSRLALAKFEEAEAVATTSEQKIQALQNAAAMYHILGESSKTLNVLNKAEALCKNMCVELANLKNTRGVAFLALGDKKEAIDAFISTLAMNPQHGHAALNLAQQIATSDPIEAARLYRIALEAPDVSAGNDRVTMLNELALILDAQGKPSEAVPVLEEAVAIDPNSVQAVGNLAIYRRDAGDLVGALEAAERGLEIAPDSVPMLHNVALIYQKAGDEFTAIQLWRQAMNTTTNQDFHQPQASLAHIEGHRGNIPEAKHLYADALQIARRNSHPDVDALRLQLATSGVPHIYESTHHARQVHDDYLASLKDLLLDPGLRIDDPIHSTGSGALGYYLEYVGQPDLPPRRTLAQIYWRASRSSLAYLAPFLSDSAETVDTRIRVGFLSAFVFTHSVGLLTRGVIEGLDRKSFHVTLIEIQAEASDDLSSELRATVDEHVLIPSTGTLRLVQERIAQCRLDVIVFCEIGMNTLTYFLAFARLARRSVLFWGHAVTSGISRIDAPEDIQDVAGGIDYFVSSELYEPLDEEPQNDYSEQLWLMQGLTTCFPRPRAPDSTLQKSHLFDIEHERLYLVPQTLYKVHPDFDTLLASILRSDPAGVVALPTAQLGDWTESLDRRWQRTLAPELKKRVVFVRRLTFAEFIRFAQLADVVLDPFPVGGGRSSLEILSVGTPIIVLEERTSVLRLTSGFYKRMDSPCPECITHSFEEFETNAILLATNRSRLDSVRKSILERNYRLYEDQSVVDEWQDMLNTIVKRPRPDHRNMKPIFARDQMTRPSVLRYIRRGFWGYELVQSEYGLEGEPDQSEFRYSVKLFHPDPRRRVDSTFFVGVPHDASNATLTARALSDYIDAEPVKFRWIAAVLQNGAHRSQSPVVATVHNSIHLHLGDDLHQMAVYYNLNPRALDQAVREAGFDPESTKWLRARSERDLLVAAAPFSDMKKSVSVLPSETCLLTIGITTCKRLRHFQATMRALSRVLDPATSSSPLAHPLVCRVYVIDDASSKSDRSEMAAEWPDLDFVHKSPQFRGHAQSMNLLLRLIETQYFLYLEDDWLTLDHVAASHVLNEPLEVLRHAAAIGEPLVQVLLNDQSSRGCAYAVPNGCPSLGTAGWPRKVNDSDTRYSLHEFGVLHPDHAFTYWPGFTLNPAIWDVHALSAGMSKAGFVPMFDTEDRRFEQAFSLKAYDAGLRVAYLPRVTFAHIGVDESAYGLNNFTRPWEEDVLPS